MRSKQNSWRKAPPVVFFAAVVLVFFSLLSAADSIGFVPYYIDGSTELSASGSAALADSHDLALSDLPQLGVGASGGSADAALAAAGASAAHERPIYPVRLSISSVGIDLPVQDPSTVDVDALDALLAAGPARYAHSATLGQGGNVVIFAHSSHLPIVHNKMFQAFNQIPSVSAGDIIVLTGTDGRGYVYRTDSVVRATTDDGTKIPLQLLGTKLTLVTCDTLTGKSARFILTASFIGTD